MAKTLNVAMIGYGFMGRAHSNAYRQVNQFFDLEYRPVLKVACARDADKLAKFAENWGWESTETDWRKLIERKDIDAIDIGSPNNTHKEIALAAAAAGKMVLCEKPLAMDLAEATAMTEAVEKAGVAQLRLVQLPPRPGHHPGQADHRRGPARPRLPLPRQLPPGLDDQPRPAPGGADPLAARQGGRRLGRDRRPDQPLGRHRHLAQRADHQGRRRHRDLHQGAPAPGRGRGRRSRSTIDDACQFLCRFANGSLGLFESTRYARGRKNQNTFEINGENASIAFDLEDPHRLQYFDHTDPDHLQGWRSIHVTGFEHPYMKNWWVPGTTIGYEHTFINALADFLKGLETGTPASPTFRDALPTQAVCDAVLDSAEVGQWQAVVPV